MRPPELNHWQFWFQFFRIWNPASTINYFAQHSGAMVVEQSRNAMTQQGSSVALILHGQQFFGHKENMRSGSRKVCRFCKIVCKNGSLLLMNDQNFKEHLDHKRRSNFKGMDTLLSHWTSLISYEGEHKIARKVKKWTSHGKERKEDGWLIQFIITVAIMYHCVKWWGE